MNVKAIALLSSAGMMVLVESSAGQDTSKEALDVIRDLEIRASESLSRIRRIGSRSEAESATISVKHKLLRSFGFDRIGGDSTAAPIGHVVGTLSRLGYRVDKVVFESFPGYLVTANVYVPGARALSREGKSPGILLLPDFRASSGKSEPVIQRLGHVMAQRGYLVFAFDPMGQGERRSASAEDAELLSLGVSPAGIDEYEIRCGLAYLASLVGIDTGRIGLVTSGGSGFRALASLAVEDKVTSAAIMGDFNDWAQVVRYPSLDSSNRSFVELREILPGVLRYADYEELLTLATAKRVLLLSTGSSSDTILPRIGEYGRNLFRWFGAEDRFSTRQMSTEDRADAVNIISSWFTEKPLANALEDDFVPLVDDPDLACLPQPLPRPARITNVMWQQFLKARLRVSLDSSQPFENAGDPIKDDRPRTVGLQIRTAQAVRFPTQGITISGIVYRPGVDGGGAESGILIAVDDEGSGTPTDDPVLQEALKRNWQIWAIDPRGIGSSSVAHPQWLATVSLLLGENFVWRQASDLRKIVAFAIQATSTRRVGLYARGRNVALASLYAISAQGQGPSPLSLGVLRDGLIGFEAAFTNSSGLQASSLERSLPAMGYFVFDTLPRGATLSALLQHSAVPIWLIDPITADGLPVQAAAGGRPGPPRQGVRTLQEFLTSDW